MSNSMIDALLKRLSVAHATTELLFVALALFFFVVNVCIVYLVVSLGISFRLIGDDRFEACALTISWLVLSQAKKLLTDS